MATGIVAAAFLATALQAHPTALRLADDVSQGSPTHTLRACNQTSSDVVIGVSYIPVGEARWRNKGWSVLAPQACDDLLVTTNKYFYARAEIKDDPNSYWGDTAMTQCVEYPGPYDFWTNSEDTSCPEGDAAAFTRFESDGKPTLEWDLSAPDQQ